MEAKSKMFLAHWRLGTILEKNTSFSAWTERMSSLVAPSMEWCVQQFSIAAAKFILYGLVWFRDGKNYFDATTFLSLSPSFRTYSISIPQQQGAGCSSKKVAWSMATLFLFAETFSATFSSRKCRSLLLAGLESLPALRYAFCMLVQLLYSVKLFTKWNTRVLNTWRFDVPEIYFLFWHSRYNYILCINFAQFAWRRIQRYFSLKLATSDTFMFFASIPTRYKRNILVPIFDASVDISCPRRVVFLSLANLETKIIFFS